jgi:nucleoid-associated protein YgaU
MAIQSASLRGKYQKLIDSASLKGVSNLQVRQEGNVLYIDGTAPSNTVKQELWDIYNTIDPDYRSGDLIMNINSFGGDGTAQEEYTVEKGDNLSKIGKKYGLNWQDIYDANKDLIADPDLIQPGWKLKIPKKNQ